MILNTIQPTLVTATCEIPPIDAGVTAVTPNTGGGGGNTGGGGGGVLYNTVDGYYEQGNIGPISQGAHFDIKRSDRGDYGRTSLDKYVLVNGQPLSSGVTVPGGMYGAPRSYGGHAGYDYAFPPGARLTLINGATWVGNTPGTANGDIAVFQTPDGTRYQILHGKFHPPAV
jgi:hypothetical protein